MRVVPPPSAVKPLPSAVTGEVATTTANGQPPAAAGYSGIAVGAAAAAAAAGAAADAAAAGSHAPENAVPPGIGRTDAVDHPPSPEATLGRSVSGAVATPAAAAAGGQPVADFADHGEPRLYSGNERTEAWRVVRASH